MGYVGGKKSSETKNRLYKQWLISQDPIDIQKYKTHVRVYNKIVKLAESDYYQRTFNSNINSIKSLWKENNSLCCFDSSRNQSAVSKLIVNGEITSDARKIVNEFNTFSVMWELMWLVNCRPPDNLQIFVITYLLL